MSTADLDSNPLSLDPSRYRSSIYLLVLLSGMAALSWEVVWQIKSTLALGVSAWGTALTLAVTMGGMSVGAIVMGRILRNRDVKRPVRIYSILEFIIGISGLFLGLAFQSVEKLDSWAYTVIPDNAGIVHLMGIALSLGIPTMCLGATMPVLGLAARQFKTSIALLYALNTLGAAVGVLLVAFLLIPWFGISHTIWIIAAVNITIGISAWILGGEKDTSYKHAEKTKHISKSQLGFVTALFVVSVTGFSTFVLEVAWFRSLTAAFMSTTDAFAIMLASVLISLGFGAWLVPDLKKNKVRLGLLIGWAGILILLATPVIERFDLFIDVMAKYPFIIFLQWFGMTLFVIGLPVLLLGIALPWILDDQDTPAKWGTLYGINALSAIIGTICASWLFLPTIGFARTAWVTGAIVLCTGIFMSPREKRTMIGGLGIIALLVAVIFESGVGRTRVQGTISYYGIDKPNKILEAYEGADVTASAVEYENGPIVLFIDGFSTAVQGDTSFTEHYMSWMGHMPMLLHPNPKNALVICFGTGQTANAVRRENPESLDIVDINANVLKLAHNFPSNENVLEDPRVKTIIMDGRAYVRRTNKIYDIITLEPMPPTFAGVNALYSKEFYQLSRKRLSPDGVIAQWLPFHLVPPYYSASIAKTFQSVFPNAILWIDPPSLTGILLGSVDETVDLGKMLPGFERTNITRSLSEKEVLGAIFLNREGMERYSAHGEIIEDDNQLLSYGKAAHMLRAGRARSNENHALLKKIRDNISE